jgi:cytochrome c-type biogenesis protein
MFVALGMSATSIGSVLRDHQELLNTIAGWTIIALGVFMIAALFLTRLNRDMRPDVLMRKAGSGGPVVAGLAFAVAWTPCVGPTLGSILAAASTSDTVGQGGVLLAFYSAGLAIPFLVTAVAFERATNAFGWVRKHHRAITAISGLILIGMGLLILTGELTQLNSDAQETLDGLGLDWLYRL